MLELVPQSSKGLKLCASPRLVSAVPAVRLAPPSPSLRSASQHAPPRPAVVIAGLHTVLSLYWSVEPVPALTKTSTSPNESLSDSLFFFVLKCDLLFRFSRYKPYTQALNLPSAREVHHRRSEPKKNVKSFCNRLHTRPPWPASAAHRVQSPPARPLALIGSEVLRSTPPSMPR